MNIAPSPKRAALLAAILANLFTPTVVSQSANADRDRADRDRAVQEMVGRGSVQMEFLFSQRELHPVEGLSVDEMLRWMDRAEEDFAAEVGKNQDAAGGHFGSSNRYASIAPYVWSLVPRVIMNAEENEELVRRVHTERLLPALLKDLEAVVRESEPGAAGLLRFSDLGNGLAHVDRLEFADRALLERFQSTIAELPAVLSRWQAKAPNGVLPRHLRSASWQFQRYTKLLDVELGLREGRLERAQSLLSGLAVPGALPSGLESMICRTAIAYRDAGRRGEALAVLDLGLLSTTESDWPAAELRPLYESCHETRGGERFALAVARRLAPLSQTSIRFDAGSLVDIETGKPLDMESLKGKAVVLDFIQRNCHACMVSVPKVQKFDETHEDIVVLSVVVDKPENRKAAAENVRERGGRYPILHDTSNWAERLGVVGYPSYVLVSSDGFVFTPMGQRTEPTHVLEDVIETVEMGRVR